MRTYRVLWKWHPITRIFNENVPVLLKSEVFNAEWTLVSSRIVRRKAVPIEHGRNSHAYVPLGGQSYFIIDRELTAALCVVKPQALLP
jgi:hypothetical protein